MPPNTPGSRRTVPRDPSPKHVDQLRWLVEQGEHWVLRGDWAPFLETGSERHLVPLAGLSRDQRIAAWAWLRQQRHLLHAALDHGQRAPDGWLESLPLYRALADGLA